MDIGRLIADAKAQEAPIDVAASADELYLRFLSAGCSRIEIAEALTGEATDAGLTTH
jgi:hypothetical protein